MSTASEAPAAGRRGVVRSALGDLWRRLPDLVIFDVLFKVLGLLMLAPLAAGLFRLLISASGKAAVGNVDIARFLLTPVGLAALVIGATMLLLISFLEIGGLMHIGLAAAMGRRASYWDALRLVARRSTRLIRMGLLQMLLLLAAAAPFLLLLWGIAQWLVSEHDINYYLDERPPELKAAMGWGLVTAAVGAVVLAGLYVALAFALPETLFRDIPVRAAVWRSFALVKRHARRVALVLIGWLVVSSLASLAVHGAIYGLGRLLVAGAGQRMSLLLPALGLVTVLSMAATAVLAFVALAFNTLLIMRLYVAAAADQRAQLASWSEQAPPLRGAVAWSLPKWWPLWLAAGALLLGAVVVWQLIESVNVEDRVEIAAHRGSSQAAPENTLAAVEQAIADGATIVEVDVQETADGVIVVAHDADLMRVAGQPLVITQTNFPTLQQVDVGAKLFPELGPQRIPTLEQVIDTVEGRVWLIVELKSYAGDGRRLADKVADMLLQRRMETQAVVMSLEYDELARIEQRHPELTTGFVSSVSVGDISRLDVDFLAIAHAKATDALIGAAHSQHKQVYVWTVDDPRTMSTMIDRGVDTIITNVPAVLVGVLQERAELSDVERVLLRFRSLYVD